MDTTLIDTFIEVYGQNKKQGRVWDEFVYASIQSAVFAKTKKEIKKNHIINRMRTMRNEFNGFVDIVNKSRFGWNQIKQTVDADDQAWIDILADHEVSHLEVSILLIEANLTLCLICKLHMTSSI